MQEQDIYQVIGEEGFARLVGAFYQQIPGDDILGPLYSTRDLAGAEQRLRDFLISRFGGPPRYIEQRGHPRLRMRHAPFPIGDAARNRWILLMERAIEQAALPAQAAQTLRSYFDSTATFLINRQSPEGV